MELEEFRKGLDTWLDEHGEGLAASQAAAETIEDDLAQIARTKAATFDAGWMRYGWPERVGGLGGSTLLRGYLLEALALRDIVVPGLFTMTEVLAPTVIDYARPELAAEMVPRMLRGDEVWCQGFSEPDTGSNLGALTCRARRGDDGWHVTGQKVWTSLAAYAQRCILLTRTGTTESAHRGITAMFVDVDSPGVTVRPIQSMHGEPEFAEVFFDDCVVPFERTLGEEGQGWAVAMDVLPYERSTAMWVRAAYLHRRLRLLVETAPEGAVDPAKLGEVTEILYAFRSRSRATQHRLASGGTLGAETSIDKALVAMAEQAVFDLIEESLPASVLLGDDPASHRLRAEFVYSRAASIYGGSSEVQRNIIARRLLDLGNDRG